MTDPSKIKPTHTQRAACVYIRQSTPGQVEHNRESTARQYALADRAAQLGWPKEQVVIIDEDLGAVRFHHRQALRLRSPHQRSGPGSRGHRSRTGSFSPREKQRGLVSLAGTVRRHRYSHWRQRWRLSPSAVQRSLAPRPKGDHERSRISHHSRPTGRRYPQQGGSRRTAPRIARGLRLGRTGW